MTVVRKYPTLWSDGVGWTNPQRVIGAPDSLCATFGTTAATDRRIYVSGFGFAIPAGSTINSVKVGMHALIQNGQNLAAQHLFVVAWDRLGLSSVNAANKSAFSGCGFCSDSDTSCGYALTVDDFNDEDFTAYIQAVCTFDNGFWWYATNDADWIEVDYTEPPPSAATIGSGVGHALLLVAGMYEARRKKRKKIVAVSLG